MEPDNKPIQKEGVLRIFDFPTKAHKGHSTVKKDQYYKSQHSNPINVV
jgi:hypothetical protein